MPQRGMRSPSFSQKTPPRTSLSKSMIEQTIDAAETIIMRWDIETPSYARVTSLFYESKTEATHFIKSVNELHKIMHDLVPEHDFDSKRLIQAQRLMQIAMKRLQKEFYQILSMNRAHLDPESVSTRSSRISTQSSLSDFDFESSPDSEIHAVGDSLSDEEVSFMAMSDLKSIADCMIGSGYVKECIQIYKIIRKSIIDEAIYTLGVEKLSSSRINKMDPDELDMKIRDWLLAMKVSMTALFTGERILCDYIFSTSDSIRESCFSEITKEGAIALFEFPELIAKSKKSRPKKMFRLLDMCTAISDNWQEIETIFSYESTSAVRLQALNSLTRLNDSIQSDFESKSRKDSSKAMVSGGGLHPQTISMITSLTWGRGQLNHLSFIVQFSINLLRRPTQAAIRVQRSSCFTSSTAKPSIAKACQ